MNIFRWNKASRKYKTLDMNVSDEGDGVYITMKDGKKGGGYKLVSLKLTNKEIAYILIELQKMYDKIEEDNEKE